MSELDCATAISEPGIMESLRGSILGWGIQPGTQLEPLELAKRFKASGATIAQILDALMSEDLVRYVPKRGFFVAEISIPDLIELAEVRSALEPMCASLAACAISRGHATALPSIRQKLCSSRELIISGGGCSYARLAKEFDDELVRLAGNSRLAAALVELSPHLHRARALTFANQQRLLDSIPEHVAILDDVLAGNDSGAHASAERHVALASEALLGLVKARA